jgi:uncharacterized protein YdhG (YjbR/CyaY superfamily)
LSIGPTRSIKFQSPRIAIVAPVSENVTMPAKLKTHADYLDSVSEEQRAALEKIRAAILAAAPKAEECFSYGLPAFQIDGKPLAGFAAAAKHCAFYPMSGSIIEVHQDVLANYDTSKGTIRFPAEKSLPDALVKKLVKARMAEIKRRGK